VSKRTQFANQHAYRPQHPAWQPPAITADPMSPEHHAQTMRLLGFYATFWQAVRARKAARAVERAARPINRSREMARRLRQQPWLARA
jgi:hypothetical protein